MARITTTAVAMLLIVPGMALVAFAPGATAVRSYFDVTITSFDGTNIETTVFIPDGASKTNPVPFILMTHGWAGTRTDEPTGRVAEYLAAGYGVLTWDSRGFGESGGSVQLNSPDYEVRDVQAILTWLARNLPVAQLDGPDDPRVGMSGVSYAGGIQLLAAAFDDRIDAIAPEITWNNLVESLGPNGVPKLYWTSLLLAAGQEASCVNARNGDPGGALRNVEPATLETGCQTNDLARWYAMVHATNSIPDEVRDGLLARSPSTYMGQIDVPTLLVQGFPDTLFDVNQAVANYEGIKANGAPVKLWLYDGGHARPENGAHVPNTQGALIGGVVLNWFDRHLRGDTAVDTGPEVEYYANGAWRNATAWPDPLATARSATLAGIPALVLGPLTGGNQGTYAWSIMPGDAAATTLAVGRATLSFELTGVAPEAFLYVGLGIQQGTTVSLVSDQVQPVRVVPSPTTPTAVQVDLVDVAATVPPGANLVVTFATSDLDYGGNRAPGYVNIRNLQATWSTVGA